LGRSNSPYANESGINPSLKEQILKIFLHLFLVIAGVVINPGAVWSQNYPLRPVKLVVPYPPGGATDTAARLMAQALNEALGQPFTVENKPGVGGMLAIEQVANAPADGYTLLVASTGPAAISPLLYKNRNFDPLASLEGIISFASAPGIIVTRNGLKVSTVKELIDASSQKPSALTMASAGSGSFQHLLGVHFQSSVGVKWTHIPLKGSAPALTEIAGDRIDVMVDVVPSAAPLIKAGRMRAIAVTTPRRSGQLPEVPTLEELGIKGYDKSGWHALFAPKGTSTEVIQRVNGVLNRSLALSDMKSKLAAIGADAEGGPPEKLTERMRTELREWAEVIRLSGATVE
jgi:tripartite-type tricarboxylate transporter receptor subunit TctC